MKQHTRATNSLRAMLAEWRRKDLAPLPDSLSASLAAKDCRRRSVSRPRSDQEALLWNGLLRLQRDLDAKHPVYCAFRQ
jgi:hypothetical protein